ncbi:hypothetical protein LZC95_33945 [Pendulispora brunnea]|uniref:Uncharacterized protein n=1 Tax=Pendulispora brunnea TaxID=2905690 RepID=A0ABZ2K263_9BACT
MHTGMVMTVFDEYGNELGERRQRGAEHTEDQSVRNQGSMSSHEGSLMPSSRRRHPERLEIDHGRSDCERRLGARAGLAKVHRLEARPEIDADGVRHGRGPGEWVNGSSFSWMNAST